MALSRELMRLFDEGRVRFDAATGFLDDRALTPWLATLGADEAVLDFDLSGARALALIGTRDGVSAVAVRRGSTQIIRTRGLLARWR